MIEDHGRQYKVGELIRAAGKRSAPSDDDARLVLAAVQEAWQRTVRRRRRRHRFAAAALMAAAAILVAVGVTSWRAPEGPAATVAKVGGTVQYRVVATGVWQPLTSTAAVLEAGARVRTSNEGRASFDLMGVSVRMDHSTEIVFESATLVALDSGRVYVDSGAGLARRGIELATDFGMVRDVGTQFEVQSFADGLRVRVREGRVQLRPSGARGEVSTAAGEQLILTEQGDVRRERFSPADSEWAWAEGLGGSPELDGRSAYDALRWAAREMGRRLTFADPVAELRARSTILSAGGADVSLTPADVLEIVAATVGGIDCAIADDAVTVRSR